MPLLEETEHERAAREFFASLSDRHEAGRWRVVRRPAPGTIYDFASPVDRQFGQCWLLVDGSWGQEPLGVGPVVLAFLGPKGKRR